MQSLIYKKKYSYEIWRSFRGSKRRKEGKLIARSGWNGKGMFVFQRPEDWLSTDMIVNKVKSLPDSFKKYVNDYYDIDETNMIKFCSYLCMKDANDNIVNGWLASQSEAFEKIEKHDSYLGKRKNRGLFQSSVGKLINADVNGALNIMRKVVGDSCESIRRIIDRGLLFNPVRITNVFC